MNPSNWTTFESNLPTNLLSALKLSKSLPSSNVGIYIQDKSARICFAALDKTNAKLESMILILQIFSNTLEIVSSDIN